MSSSIVGTPIGSLAVSASSGRSASPSPSPNLSLGASPAASLGASPNVLLGTSPSVGPGRQTPSPLPSLQELRQLHRANSAASRRGAMAKLLGERESQIDFSGDSSISGTGIDAGTGESQENIRDDDDEEEEDVFGAGLRAGAMAGGVALQRSGSLGSRVFEPMASFSMGTGATSRLDTSILARRLGQSQQESSLHMSQATDLPLSSLTSVSAEKSQDLQVEPQSSVPGASAPLSHLRSQRPVLGRSNTISTGDGSERRSVIGRRMMERLGNRVQLAQESSSNPSALGRRDDGPSAPAGISGLAAMAQAAAKRRKDREERQAQEAERQAAMMAQEGQSSAAEALERDPFPHPHRPNQHPRSEESINPPRSISPSASAQQEFLASPLGASSSQQTSPSGFLHPERAGSSLSRSNSRATSQSNLSTSSSAEAFEYQSHLRRSLSARKAKALEDVSFERPTTPEQQGAAFLDSYSRNLDAQKTPTQSSNGAPGASNVLFTPSRYDDAEDGGSSTGHHTAPDLVPLMPFAPPFAHAPSHSISSSTASDATVSAPIGGERVPFVLARDPLSHTAPNSHERNPSFPAPVSETSTIFGTPSRELQSAGQGLGQVPTAPAYQVEDSGAGAGIEESERSRKSSTAMSWYDVGSEDVMPDAQPVKKASLVDKMKSSLSRSMSGRSTPSASPDPSSSLASSTVSHMTLTPRKSSPLPAVSPSDPRIQSSKLFPAPLAPYNSPPMLQQVSESAIPSLQRALEQHAPATSQEPIAKSAWLADTFSVLHPSGLPAARLPSPANAPQDGRSALAPRTKQILARLDRVLAADNDDRPDILDDPPRRLVLSAPVLQVVNQNTVKPRYLMLFSDILLISKPSQPENLSLDNTFSVKSVIHLDELSVSHPPAAVEDSTAESSKHPTVLQFVDLFSRDAPKAIAFLLARSQLDDSMLAGLLLKSPELDKEQIGRYLAANPKLLSAFVGKFQFQNVRLDEALRSFLLALRLPSEPIACETLLEALAHGWHAANKPSFSDRIAFDLILAMMQLNDSVNPTASFGFAFPNPMITVDDWVTAFRSKDPQNLVPKEYLEAMYRSIRKERLVQSLASNQNDLLRQVITSPSRLPTRLTLDCWSEKIYVSIPKADPGFRIKLQGEGLKVEPSVLDFSDSIEESFRVMGVGLGAKSLLFSRMGTNAPYYANLPNTKTFLIERSFMNHTFNVSFTNHLGTRRKYCFSFEDEQSKRDCLDAVVRCQESVRNRKAQVLSSNPSTSTEEATKQQVAERVSLKVLQRSLLEPEVAITGAKQANAENTPPEPQSGKDIVLTCRQNSLLPIVLGLVERLSNS